MIVGKYILLFTCLGIGVALCVGAISILRSPPDNFLCLLRAARARQNLSHTGLEGHLVSTAAAPAGISVPSPGNPGSEILVFVAWAVIPATFWIFAVTGFFSASSGFRWFPSWMAGETGWSVWTWAGNFGLALPLSLALAISLSSSTRTLRRVASFGQPPRYSWHAVSSSPRHGNGTT